MTGQPWRTDDFPELRPGPPWVMNDMVAEQPSLLEGMLGVPPSGAAEAAEVIADAISRHQPVIVCGCGTSEHSAQGVAVLLSAALDHEKSGFVQARPALSARLDPNPGVCVAVSHDGGTRATTLALLAARASGAETIAITNRPDASVAQAAQHVLCIPRHDDSWCHTVAYTSALAAGATISTLLGQLTVDPASARSTMQEAIDAGGYALVARYLADRRVVLCAGAGVDHVTARELALKIAEGAQVPAFALELETVVHGQLVAHDPSDALILVALADHPDQERLVRRLMHIASAAAAIGLPVAGLFSQAYDRGIPAEATPAGRVVIELPGSELLDPHLAALLGGAGVLQALTLELARARNTNPDLIRREETLYRRAAEEAEGPGDW